MQVIFSDLPLHISGMIKETFDDGEDRYTIVLNARLNDEQQRKAYFHELRHLDEGDLDRINCSVDEIEYIRHLGVAR